MLSQTFLTNLVFTSLVALNGISASTVKLDFQKHVRSTPNLHKRGHVQAVLPEAGGLAYLMNLELGTPPQRFSIQFDTGSSNTWVPTPNSAYCQVPTNYCNVTGSFDSTQSSTFQNITAGFRISYGLGSAAGDYVNDTLHVGDITIPDFTFGLANKVPAANAAFGIAAAGLSSLEVAAQTFGVEFPTLIDALFNAGAIDRRAFSVYLDDQEAGQGSVLFGGIDPSKYTGPLTTFAMAPNGTGQYDRYRIDMTSISFVDDSGKVSQLSASGMAAPAILDTGASLLILPKTVANSLATGLGAVLFQNTYYVVDCKYRASSATLNIQFGGKTGAEYKIPVNQLIGDPSQSKFPNGAQACQLNIEGLDEGDANVVGLGGFTLGDPFLRSVYIVYDQDSYEISLAAAKFNQTGSGNIADFPSGTAGISQAATVVTALPTDISTPYSLTGVRTGTAVGGTTAAITGTAITANPGTPTFSLVTASAGASGSSSSGGSGGKSAAAAVDVPVTWTFAFGFVTLCLAVFL